MPTQVNDRELVEEIATALEDACDLTISIDPVKITKAVREVDGCVAIASWCLGPLYRACVGDGTKLSDIRTASALLVACPEHLAAWNLRKRHFNRTGNVSEELRFNKVILLRAPKAGEAWAHRAWILERAELTYLRVKLELDFARKLAGKTFANYYAGGHRVQMLRCAASSKFDEITTWELGNSRYFLATHPRDASAWNAHRAAVLAAPNGMDVEEVQFVADMKQRYPTSQSVATHVKWWDKKRTSVA